MTSLLQNNSSDEIIIIYDGDCPLCANYTDMLRLKQTIKDIKMINARDNPRYIEEMKRRKLDINEGMLVIYSNNLYYGADAMHILALLSSKSPMINKVINLFFRSKILATLLYPLCKLIRTGLLFILKRPRIN